MTEKKFDNAVTDLIQSIGLMVRRARAVRVSGGLSLTESLVMSRLAREGPATTADLARAEGMKPQSMGSIITTLEKTGMVERKPHPTDGRRLNIELTAKGAELRKRTKDAKLAWLTQAIAQLDEEEQKTLFAAGEIIKRLAES